MNAIILTPEQMSNFLLKIQENGVDEMPEELILKALKMTEIPPLPGDVSESVFFAEAYREWQESDIYTSKEKAELRKLIELAPEEENPERVLFDIYENACVGNDDVAKMLIIRLLAEMMVA